MSSVANNNEVDTRLQEAYLNDRCAYLTEQLAQQHKTQVSMRTRSASVSNDRRIKQTPVSTRRRPAFEQVWTHWTVVKITDPLIG